MKKKTAVSIITALSILLAVAVAVAITSVNRAEDSERYIAANYRHAFSEVVTGISELDTALQKSLLVTSPSMAGAVCAEIFAKAQTAEMALGVLPFSATELEKTSGFINRVGDYAFSLSRKAGRGEELSQEEREGLSALSETASVLAMNMKSIEEELGSAMVGIEEYARSLKALDEREGEFIPETLADSVSLSEREFPEIPSLIYDGPFSEHLKEASPKLLEDMDVIDQSQGRKAAASFLGIRAEQVYPTGEQEGNLPAYCYGTEAGGSQINLWVSKTGGVVYGMLNSRPVQSSELSAEEALEKAKAQLEKWGYTSMRESYYMISGNVLTANFAYEQDGVICYPDLIKVGVALDNGAIQSFEAMGYVSAHTSRQLPEVKVSAQEAAGRVPEGLTVEGEALAVIPTAGKYELLCHEFKCLQEDGRRFIIYVNAQTGEQERILILLEDENGALTI